MLLRLMSWPYLRKHALRTLLTTAGIALGVAVFMGMRTANQNVIAAFSATVDRIAGKTELEVSSGDTGFNEDVLDKVQSARSVRVAVPVIEAIGESKIQGQGNLFVLAVDMTGDRSLRDYDLDDGDDDVIQDPLIFIAQPDSLILSKEFADRNHIKVGARLPLGTAEGERVFVVRGIMKSTGVATAYGGNLAVMDIFAAQKMFGRGRTFDRIDLAAKPGVPLEACQRELQALLGPAFEVRPPSARGQQFETLLAGYSLMMGISSAFALFIGMFIIYNSFAIAVAQRRSEIGILRALGASRAQVRGLFLGEGAVLGLVGSTVGVLCGLAVARAIASLVSGLIANFYSVAQQGDDLWVNPRTLVLAIVIGMITSILAAALPAAQAASLDPVKALQKGNQQLLSAGENRYRAIVAMVLIAASVICLATSESRPVFYTGYALGLIAVLLLGPALSLLLAKAMRPVLTWLRPVEGALAADSLIRAPRRTSAGVAALMFSLALVVAFDGMARASNKSILNWMNTTLDPDLFVLPSQSLEVQTIRFPADMGPELAALPGVKRLQTLRNSRITFRDTPVMIVAIEVRSVAESAQQPPVAGRADEMYRRTEAGEGLMVSDNLAQLQHLSLGDVLDIPAPYGNIHLPIVGIVVDYSDQQGAIIMDRSLFMKYWHDDSVNAFRLYTAPGVRVEDVRQRVLSAYSGRRQVFVLTNGELKSYIGKVTSQWFRLTTVQIGVAVLIALLGIVNTLTVSITDRRRELAVLRAVGAARRQVRWTIYLEALAIGALGLTLGCSFGAINLLYVLQIVQHDIAGIRLGYQFPLLTALALIPAILGTALIASLWPAKLAVRGSLVEALEYE
ncbi:MAG TPA: FtsX-like permease family protein [Vicinamibacterales bacterium]|nr:FtsX-like permease family protein [Vicinamibacterales bacterium]